MCVTIEREPVYRPCDRCRREDEAGGVLLRDNTGASGVFCRDCTRKIFEVVPAPAPEAREAAA